MAKILGLDLGTNSIGWAVVEHEDGEFKLQDKGVRIFQEGVKIEKGIEGSKAAERTEFRSARRLKYRRKTRKINTLKALSENGFCPKLNDNELKDWKYKRIYPQNVDFINWLRTDEFENKTPYYYRHLAVTKKLDITNIKDRFIIGRAFYHMAQRRGFLSNRLEGTKENLGVVKKSIAEISDAKGEKTLGQYFYEKYQKGEKIRDTYTHRIEHYLEEFNKICEFQNLPKDFAEKVRKAIFYQRPLKSQKGLIGKCVFEKNKPRCATSQPIFEEYRMLCFINNIKIKTPQDEKLRFLTKEEREKIKSVFYRKSKPYFDFEDIAKQFAPKNRYKFYKNKNINSEDFLFNYSMNTTVSGCPVSARLKELFGEDFQNIKFDYIREKDQKKSEIDINDIWHVLNTFDSDEKLAAFAKNRLGFDDKQIKEILKINLKQEYASLSLKAINKILPYLREGLIYSHAVFLANMEEVIPKEIWNVSENRKVIRDEIYNIIQTQNEEKQIIDIVNGMIKSNQTNKFTWSNEAISGYKDELSTKIISFFGKNKYDSFAEKKKNRITENAFNLLKKQMQKNMGKGEFAKAQRIDDRVKTFITDNFEVNVHNLKKIYHPSALDIFKPPIKSEDGRLYLGSPTVSSVRNPMAMRALHQLRKVINELIKNDIIDESTKINIEMARDLKNANERKALQRWQRDNEKKRKEYAERIKEHFTANGINLEPSEDEILKYQLWEEQNRICIYTGRSIGVSDFLGTDPKFDIEHTIPRSQSFDNSQENKTLCENRFNRGVKKNEIPYKLDNYDDIINRIQPWKEKIDDLNKQIEIAVRQSKGAKDKESKDRFIQKRHKLIYECNYWKNKYSRFTMKDVPEGFKNSQIVDTGIITKYSRMYLKTLFNKVYTVKGNTVADFRKMWDLQHEFKKKERVNHIHHCIDAITMACITKENYEQLAKFYHDWEELERAGVKDKPKVKKPWNSFTEDVKTIEKEVLISHYTPDVLPKQSKKKLRKRGKIVYNKNGQPIIQQGDTVRGSLHQDTFYGAIEQMVENKKGEKEKQIKYVVRKQLNTLEEKDFTKIVDANVRKIVINGRTKEKELRKEIDQLKKKLSKAEENEEPLIKNEINVIEEKIEKLYALPNKNGNPIPIKKVRIYTPTVTNPIHLKPQRDKSLKNPKPYKEYFHVANDGNYCMAIYEGKDEKGKIKRNFEIVNNLKAGQYFKLSKQKEINNKETNQLNGLVPNTKMYGKIELPLKGILKTGTMVLFWEKSPDEIWEVPFQEKVKRLYKIIGFEGDGRIQFRFHQTALPQSSQNKHEMTIVKYMKENNLKNSEINFKNPVPWLRLTKGNHNFIVNNVDFKISPIGEISKI